MSDNDGTPSRSPRIKALPCWWKGWKFRSRLEARWAVFFDYLRIEAQYEPAGFKLQDGTCYLPDFYLPIVKSWAEVKPREFNHQECLKCQRVVLDTGGVFLLLSGPPDFRCYPGLSRDAGQLTECLYSLDIDYYKRHYYTHQHRLFSDPDEPNGEDICSREYAMAVYESRGARFDRGMLPPTGQEPFNISDSEFKKQ